MQRAITRRDFVQGAAVAAGAAMQAGALVAPNLAEAGTSFSNNAEYAAAIDYPPIDLTDSEGATTGMARAITFSMKRSRSAKYQSGFSSPKN